MEDRDKDTIAAIEPEPEREPAPVAEPSAPKDKKKRKPRPSRARKAVTQTDPSTVYVVAAGKSITSRRGILEGGVEVRAADLNPVQEYAAASLARLLDVGIVVRK